jgi:hypothetical protein
MSKVRAISRAAVLVPTERLGGRRPCPTVFENALGAGVRGLLRPGVGSVLRLVYSRLPAAFVLVKLGSGTSFDPR